MQIFVSLPMVTSPSTTASREQNNLSQLTLARSHDASKIDGLAAADVVTRSVCRKTYVLSTTNL